MVGLKMLLVLVWLALIMVVVRWVQHRWSIHPEQARKAVHISLGLTTLAFPWLFVSPWPVVGLGVLAVSFLLAVRFWAPLQRLLGPVLGSVGRVSFGEIYFPVSIALVFWLAKGEAVYYLIPVALLTLPDAFAALVGVRYGSISYNATEGRKTVEGSATFLFSAFMVVHVPLLLFTEVGRSETLLIAAIIALICMLIEAFAWRGLDNLLVPVSGFVLLNANKGLSVNELLWRLGITMALLIFAFFYRKRTTLNDAALLGSVFIGYVSWAVGGWQWFLPALVFMVFYRLFVPRGPLFESRPHTIHAVFSVLGPGLIWLAIGGAFSKPQFMFPYLVAMASSFALVGVSGLPPVGAFVAGSFRKIVVFVLGGLFYFAVLGFANFNYMQPLVITFAAGVVLIIAICLSYAAAHSYVERRWPSQGSWFVRAWMVTLGSSFSAVWVWFYA